MKTDNVTLMRMAQKSLRGKWGLAIGTFLVYTLLTSGFGVARQTGIISLLVGGPFALGAATFSLSISRGKEARLEQIFNGFRYFSTALVTYLLMLLYVVVGLLLLIVPGIVMALRYSMTFYILADNPSLTPRAALAQSQQITEGSKWKLFYLCMRFLGLALLCVLTLGIGFLWLIPYVNVTMAEFYEDLIHPPFTLQ